ncbi:MAG: NAD-dependent epimerase/dehydratase family protein [Candidatus Marinimicrobia bacterium]|nr:NAD-dependent epimerase/dehydratase family protein [Candidatus Neomarinimicrobiota bacterium]
MDILITGAFGFVGSNLSKILRRSLNYHLIAVDIFKPDHHQYHEYYSWNNLNKIKWDKIDLIIHLAGIAHDTKNTINEKKYYDINVGLTKKVFDHYICSNADKFIFFSSVKAVADSVNEKVLTEEDVPVPQTPYGRSKLEAEKYILGHYHNNTKIIYILRPCMIHGPENKGNLNLLYQFVKKGIPWPLGAFENQRSFTSIDNLTFVIQRILEKEIKPGVYNMADDEPLSTNKLIELMSKSIGKKQKYGICHLRYAKSLCHNW